MLIGTLLYDGLTIIPHFKRKWRFLHRFDIPHQVDGRLGANKVKLEKIFSERI